MDDKVIEYEAVKKKSKKANVPKDRRTTLVAGAIVGELLLLSLSFLAGASYERSRVPEVGRGRGIIRQGMGDFGGGPGMRGIRGGMGVAGLGEVSAISSTSITVKSTRTGESLTHTINSSTKVTKDGSAATLSEIKVGDSVFVREDTTDSKIAKEILFNTGQPR